MFQNANCLQPLVWTKLIEKNLSTNRIKFSKWKNYFKNSYSMYPNSEHAMIAWDGFGEAFISVDWFIVVGPICSSYHTWWVQ